MRKCPKCSSQYGDDVRICRTCGAILAAASQEPPQPPVGSDPSPCEDEEEAAEVAAIEQDPWKCQGCGQAVPGSFEVCWNCGTSRDGTPDPNFCKESALGDDEPWEADATEQPANAGEPERECRACGSAKVIPDAIILNQGEPIVGKLLVAVDGDPEALVFKNRLYGQLTADICGDCGHVELKVKDPAALFEHYRRSQSEPGV
jgi:hypothetical protein